MAIVCGALVALSGLTLRLASALRMTVAPALVPVVALALALRLARPLPAVLVGGFARRAVVVRRRGAHHRQALLGQPLDVARSEEHTSELQSLMRISYAVFCLKKKTN